MGRNKINKPRRLRPVPSDVKVSSPVNDLYAELRGLAQTAVQEAEKRLLASGADPADIAALKGSMRALCVSDIWEFDPDALVELSKTHERGPMLVFDVLAEAILPDPDDMGA